MSDNAASVRQGHDYAGLAFMLRSSPGWERQRIIFKWLTATGEYGCARCVTSEEKSLLREQLRLLDDTFREWDEKYLQ